LILGAGATAETGIYVLEKFGLKVVVYNRSKERIIGLKEQKPEILISTNLETLEVEDEGEVKKIRTDEIAVILSTVPGNNEIVFPESLFKEKPIIFDVANNPRITRFIAEVQKFWQYIVNVRFFRLRNMVVNRSFMVLRCCYIKGLSKMNYLSVNS